MQIVAKEPQIKSFTIFTGCSKTPEAQAQCNYVNTLFLLVTYSVLCKNYDIQSRKGSEPFMHKLLVIDLYLKESCF